MRVLCALAVTALAASAQSHPSWWNWASPDATSLVGIRWETVKSTPLAGVLEDELGPDGLGFPELPLVQASNQFLLSSPSFLVLASGDYPVDRLRAEAGERSLKPYAYKGVDLWISPGKSTLSVARINDHLLLLGLMRSLEAAIDNAQAATPAERRYSPLLKRAARFSGQDLWVVAAQLPDALASHFVPLEVEARGFDGAVNLSEGIRLEGTLAAASPDDASGIAQRLRQSEAGLPSIARGLQVVQAGDMVVLAMVATREQVTASLRPTQIQPAPPVAPPAVPPPAPVAVAAPAPAPVQSGPRVVRILGLDDGPREIILPPK
jgi:hypothetical protein